MTKVCSKCKIEKPKSEFHNRKDRPCGVQSRCKECERPLKAARLVKWRAENPERIRDINRRCFYGLEPEQYRFLLESQNYKCAICQTMHQPDQSRKSLYVDHNHKTGEVRGLLCKRCNAGIGYADDSPERLQQMIDYVKKPPTTFVIDGFRMAKLKR